VSSLDLKFIVDAEAEPVDQDAALARILISLVRSATSPEETPAEVIRDHATGGRS